MFDARGILDQFCLWTTCFGSTFLSVGCGKGCGFVCRALDVVGTLVVSPGLEARRLGAPCTSTIGRVTTIG